MLVLAALLAAGADSAHASSCPLPGEKIMMSAELFFGRTLPDGSEVSDRQWQEFKDRTLSRYFRSGFTDVDAAGEWQDPRTHAIVRERSRVVLVVGPKTARFTNAIKAVSAAYRSKFSQQSVGIVTSESCAAF